jgi:hypothetical protein
MRRSWGAARADSRDHLYVYVCVWQCGVDTLSEDPMKAFNFTSEAIAAAVRMVRACNKPLLLLGGGGYHPADTARCDDCIALCSDRSDVLLASAWCRATAAVLGPYVESLLPSNVPEHEHFAAYGARSLSPPLVARVCVCVCVCEAKR